MPAVALLSEHDVRDPRDLSLPPSIADNAAEPPWLEEIAVYLISLLDLEQGWDSSGALAPRFDAVQAAFELLTLTAGTDAPRPQAVPMTDGGIQLEWHRAGIDLEVEVHSAFRFGVLYENLRTGELREEELMADLTPLRDWIEQLSE